MVSNVAVPVSGQLTGRADETLPAAGERLNLARRRLAVTFAGQVVLFGIALVIGLYNVSGSGPLWPDSPRYANGGAMIHDYLRSGNYLHPFEFARTNYAQYPGFSVPYHPPAYPGLLGLLFLVTGVSYFWARVFVAACLGVSGCLFFAISRRLEMGRLGSWTGALLFVTLPEVAGWSRDLMSEIPALMFLLAASVTLLLWIQKNQARYCWLAFALAELAFLSRVTVVGVLPAWYLYLALSGRARRLLSVQLIVATALFLGANYGWVKFALNYSGYESAAVGENARHPVYYYVTENAVYYQSRLPSMAGWGTLAAAVAGIAVTAWFGRSSRPGLYWMSWFASFYVFKWMLPIHHEQRYFLFAMPALPGLVTCLFRWANPTPVWRWIAPALAALALAVNLVRITQIPAGLVGYDAVAETLARQEKPGNVLMACWEDQDLIFRYRASRPAAERQLIRGDRTLAVRLSGYTHATPEILAHSAADVLDVIRRGRTRYVVTCELANGPWPSGHTDEMKLAHRAALSHGDSFRLLGRFPVRIAYIAEYRDLRGEVYVWEYTDALPEGKSELDVIIPTANLNYRPHP